MVNYNNSVQDVPMQSASLDIWDKKYRLKDKNGVAIDESIDDTYKRVALALSDVEETDELREYWNEQFLWALRNGAIPAGRILSNAGAEKYKPATSLINCLVSGNIVDSMDDILTKLHESGMSLKGGSGIGYCFSTLRPRGSYVHGAGSSTSGPLSFMDIYDKMCFTISSAGGRRGAQMGTFDVGHPDVFEFIRAKREDGRLRQFNLSLLITHEFIDAVKNDKEWKLSFPISDHEVSDGGKINWDEVIFREWPITEGYITNTDGLVACKVYNTVKARDLWDTIMSSTYDYSEPGFILIDRINDMNNNWWCENIISTNPCVPGETPILTREGWKPIKSLVDKATYVWNGETWSEVIPRITGYNQKLVTVRLNDGRSLTCTPAHEFILSDGTRIPAIELKENDKLIKNRWPIVTSGMDNKYAYRQGFFSGDGWVTRSNIFYIGLYGEKQLLASEFPGVISTNTYSISGGYVGTDCTKERTYLYFGRDCKGFEAKNFVPGCDWSVYSRLEWLSGLCDSDGCINRSRNSVSIQVSSKDYAFLTEVALLLNTLGVSGWLAPMKDCWRITISACNIQRLRSIGFSTRRLDITINSPKQENARFATVKSVTFDGEAPVVYCFTEHAKHRGCFNGILTSQCGEQNLPPYGSCLLGSINLTQFVEHPFTEKAEFNWDKYKNVVSIFTRMLDNVVELNGLPLEKQRQEIFNKRRHGMGFLGLGSALTMLRIRYGSKESIKFTEMVSYCTAVANFEASLDLSIEKGPAPILDKMHTVTVDMLKKRPEMRIDGYCEGDMIKGSVLHAKYSLYMKKLARSNKSLTDELERVGARFTHATSIAPTGCVDKDTLIVTNDGLKRIVEMGDATGSQWQDIDLMVSTDSGFRQATKFFVNGRKPVKTITMRSGRKFISTPNHKVRVVCPNNGYSWMSVDDLCIGMIVPSIVDDYPENVDCSKMIEFSLQDGENKRNYNLDFKSPTILTEDIAELVGFLHANGNIKTDRHMRLFHHDRYADAVFTRIEAVLLDRFNVKSSRIKDCRERAKNLSELHVYSKPLISWLSQNGLSKETSCTVSIPSRILDGGRNVIYGYLRGYFEGDGTSSVNSIAVSSTSEKLLDDMMIMMQSVGIVSSKNISLDATSDSHYGDKVVYRLSINHFIDRKRFIDRIGFLSCKNNVLHQSSRNTDRRQVTKNVLETFGCLFDRSTRKAIFSKLNEFNRLHECEFFYDEVVSIDDGFTETYDLSVPENVTYIANNLVSHNTISLSLANNASNGIEPSFSHHYSRNVIREGKKSKEKIDVFSYELLAYRHLVNQNAIPNSTCDENRLPDYFVTSDSVTPKEHIDIQAAAQRWIDSSISKTVNVPSDISYSDFKDVYLYAYEKGLKGCATFRFNPEVFQGVLVNEKDLENTTYQFKLEDGSVIEAKGNESIEYDGEIHSAANLFDAIKEGYYGKL